MKTLLSAAFGVLGALFVADARAQVPIQGGVRMDRIATQADIRAMPAAARNRVLDRMTELDCGGAPCAPATAEERTAPIVGDAEIATIHHMGGTAWTAEHCGLDWRTRQFEPMIAYLEGDLGWSERQLAVVRAIHQDGWNSRTSNAHRPCGDNARYIDGYLDFSPEQFNQMVSRWQAN